MRAGLHRGAEVTDATAIAASTARWSGVSRTDKGVHALHNVAAVQLDTIDGGKSGQALDPGALQALNEQLPADVQVLAAMQVPKRAQPRQDIACRTYDYVLPLHSLLSEQDDPAWAQLPAMGHAEPGLLHSHGLLTRWRTFRNAMRAFSGAHAFHNFTRLRDRRHLAQWSPPAVSGGRASLAPALSLDGKRVALLSSSAIASSLYFNQHDDFGLWSQDHYASVDHWKIQQPGFRTMLGVDVSAPFVLAAPAERVQAALKDVWVQAASPLPDLASLGGQWHSLPLVRVSITGSSFMYNQIRHMVGLAMAVAMGCAPADGVQRALAMPRVPMVPLAPGSGLLLRRAWWGSQMNLHPDLPQDTRGADPAPPSLRSLLCSQDQLRAWQAAAEPGELMPRAVLLGSAARAQERDFINARLVPRLIAAAESVRQLPHFLRYEQDRAHLVASVQASRARAAERYLATLQVQASPAAQASVDDVQAAVAQDSRSEQEVAELRQASEAHYTPEMHAAQRTSFGAFAAAIQTRYHAAGGAAERRQFDAAAAAFMPGLKQQQHAVALSKLVLRVLQVYALAPYSIVTAELLGRGLGPLCLPVPCSASTSAVAELAAARGAQWQAADAGARMPAASQVRGVLHAGLHTRDGAFVAGYSVAQAQSRARAAARYLADRLPSWPCQQADWLGDGEQLRDEQPAMQQLMQWPHFRSGLASPGDASHSEVCLQDMLEAHAPLSVDVHAADAQRLRPWTDHAGAPLQCSEFLRPAHWAKPGLLPAQLLPHGFDTLARARFRLFDGRAAQELQSGVLAQMEVAGWPLLADANELCDLVAQQELAATRAAGQARLADELLQGKPASSAAAWKAASRDGPEQVYWTPARGAVEQWALQVLLPVWLGKATPSAWAEHVAQFDVQRS